MEHFNELAAFAAVVREGSFTRAAASLGSHRWGQVLQCNKSLGCNGGTLALCRAVIAASLDTPK